MNIYVHRFSARCPNNGLSIRYKLRIETASVIMVEDIVALCAGLAECFHESAADKIFAAFGGRQTLAAYHHGCFIVTRRQR